MASSPIARGVLVLAWAASACGPRNSGSPDAVYRDARAMLKEGRLEAALAAAENGFRQEPSWRFRMLKAEALISINPSLPYEILQSTEPIPSPDLEVRRKL